MEQCGILAVINFNGLNGRDLAAFTHTFIKSQERGRDASGVALPDMNFIKASVPSEHFVKRPEYKGFLKKAIGQKWIIGHTRLATQGDPQFNVNNHPMVSRKGRFMVVHNGGVGSDVIESDPNKTDSYIIVKAISRGRRKGKSLFDSVKEAYGMFHGAASTIATSSDEIVFTKLVRPLYIGRKNGSIIVASKSEFFPKGTDNVKTFNNTRILGYNSKGKIRRGVVPVSTWMSEGKRENITTGHQIHSQTKIVPEWNSPKTIFVYGTLKRGFYNHDYMMKGKSKFIGTARTANLAMVSAAGGSYPIAYPEKGSSIVGEVFTVDDKVFNRLEGMELGAGYKRVTKNIWVDGKKMEAIMWIHENRPKYGTMYVSDGNWKGRDSNFRIMEMPKVSHTARRLGGWFGQFMRHSNARKLGRAGPVYRGGRG